MSSSNLLGVMGQQWEGTVMLPCPQVRGVGLMRRQQKSSHTPVIPSSENKGMVEWDHETVLDSFLIPQQKDIQDRHCNE